MGEEKKNGTNKAQELLKIVSTAYELAVKLRLKEIGDRLAVYHDILMSVADEFTTPVVRMEYYWTRGSPALRFFIDTPYGDITLYEKVFEEGEKLDPRELIDTIEEKMKEAAVEELATHILREVNKLIEEGVLEKIESALREMRKLSECAERL